MVTKIRYEDIKNLTPEEATSLLRNTEKGLVKDITVLDLLNKEILNKPFAETYFVDLYPRGIYLFFDSDDAIRYVGKTHQGFYTRLMSQLDTTHYGFFGWNALFRILGGTRTNKAHHELTEEDHEVEYGEVINYKLVLVDVGGWSEVSSDELKVLEKVIMKAFREQDGNRLVNTRVGRLNDFEWSQKIDDLMRGN